MYGDCLSSLVIASATTAPIASVAPLRVRIAEASHAHGRRPVRRRHLPHAT
jgi:hypothetical protein